ADLSVSTVTGAVSGKRSPGPKTIHAIARALNVKPEDVSGWLRNSARVSEPYTPTEESALLTDHERDALDDLIRAIARGRRAAARSDEELGPKIVRSDETSAPEEPL